MTGLGWERWALAGVSDADLPDGWGWKLTRPSGRGLGDDDVDYAAALRDGLTVPVEAEPGVLLRRRKQPWHRAAPHATGSSYLPFVTEFPFGLWIITLVPAGDEDRKGQSWHQKIWRRVPAWWGLGPQGRTAVALIARIERATWQETLAMRRSYDQAWPPCAARTAPGTRPRISQDPPAAARQEPH